MKAKKSPCTSVSLVPDAVMIEENGDGLQETMLKGWGGQWWTAMSPQQDLADETLAPTQLMKLG